ncbi:membrane protein YdbS with pleckstrin-like domain [Peribacillus deserti]|uniref:Membrane protein YdbS with pleckstrin-like domain n=1 Tax=Peribacillus deserti TaxID=673318 RepID=A0ABS2QQ63_9BACI|nr:membrane protein YdbS with pleckstrin-like domain [Peribacillus deserti]
MEPKNQISKKAIQVWRVSGFLFSLLEWGIAAGAVILSAIFNIPKWIPILLFVLALVCTLIAVFILPSLRLKHWRYEVREKEIEIQKGMFVIKRTLVPMVRVQHVDTKQGPILAKYGLSSVEISTAATTHEIPAIDNREAEQLRKYISLMATVEEEDV